MDNILTFKQFLVEGSYDLKDLKKRRQKLTDEERQQVMDAGAVWHNHPNPKYNPVPAVWKTTDSKGKSLYVCNTHRAALVKPTLKGAIKAYDFIKTTA